MHHLYVPLVVHLVNRDESTVALICGGGSGHEPSHAGFVGELVGYGIFI
jgi:dihydroxyacetone kinase